MLYATPSAKFNIQQSIFISFLAENCVYESQNFTYNQVTYEDTGYSTQTMTETFSSAWTYDPQKKFLQVNFGEILWDHIGRPGFSDIGFHVRAYSAQKIVLELDEDYVTKCPRSLGIELE